MAFRSLPRNVWAVTTTRFLTHISSEMIVHGGALALNRATFQWLVLWSLLPAFLAFAAILLFVFPNLRNRRMFICKMPGQSQQANPL